MLMLSKGSNESISFPELGITIHLLRLHSGKATIGIDAGPDVQICQEQTGTNAVLTMADSTKQTATLPKELRHEIRNALHGVSVAIHLFREQMKVGLTDDADETFEVLKKSLQKLDQHELLSSPASDFHENIDCPENEDHLLAVEDEKF